MSLVHKTTSTADPVVPDKLYFRIGEVARLLDVETHTLRFWEGEFPQLRVGKGGTGQRLYRKRDLELLFEIKHLLYVQGYTITGARQIIGRKIQASSPVVLPSSAPRPYKREAVLEHLRKDLRDLSKLLASGVRVRREHGSTVRPAWQSQPEKEEQSLQLVDLKSSPIRSKTQAEKHRQSKLF